MQNDYLCTGESNYRQKMNAQIDFSSKTPYHVHIVIDNKMEIILSSGFMYLELTRFEEIEQEIVC